MSIPQEPRLSPDQRRFQELTKKCGLEDEEALYALGRRTGGAPGFKKLSRQEQYNKIQELIGLGLSRQESERVVGVRLIQIQPSIHHPPSSKRSAIPSEPGTQNFGLPDLPKKSASERGRCFNCKERDASVVNVPPGVWLCKKCRKLFRRVRRASKRRAEFASYYGALVQPEFRGMKGIRK